MKIKPREKKVIYIGAAVVVFVAIFYAVTTFVPDREQFAQSVELKKKMLLRQRETLGLEETYKRRVEQYSKHLEQDAKLLLPGDNPNVAAADLQKILKGFADQAGVDITQKNAQPEKKILDDLTKISVHIEIGCDLDQLVQFVTAIENYEKFLKVEELMIVGYRIQKRFEIRPSLTIVGYISTPVSKPKEKSATGQG